MSKPQAYLLEPGRYPLQSEIELRFSDLDVNRHLNNVALVEILQEGRGRYHRASGMERASKAHTLMVANLSVQFLGEAFYGHPILCYTGLRSIGRSSQIVAQLALQDEKPVAYAETVMVTMVHGEPSAHSPDYREKMQSWLIKQ